MNHHKGFAGMTVLLVVLGLVVLGGAGYVAVHPEILKAPDVTTEEEVGAQEEETQQAEGKIGIAWRFTDVGEINAIQHTKVTLLVSGVPHEIGTYAGSCSEVGASGGVDGTGLLIGEVAAAQCWFAGGGDEIGVFGNEDGGIEVMVGAISEGSAETSPFRGDFKLRTDIAL